MSRPFIRRVLVIAVVLIGATASIAAAWSGHPSGRAGVVPLELIGQVNNSAPGVTPATSVQFGYVSQLGDLAGWSSASAAPLTFTADTTTSSVVNNGPLRIVSRTGRLTIYHDPSANSDFANPETFRDGTPVLTADLRQQVVVNTSTGAFTTLNVNTVRSTSAFALGSEEVLLGRVGRRFRTVLSGQQSTAAPPSAYIAGYTFSTAGGTR
jgi:hypothetical protein